MAKSELASESLAVTNQLIRNQLFRRLARIARIARATDTEEAGAGSHAAFPWSLIGYADIEIEVFVEILFHRRPHLSFDTAS
jgi:hypothetical protein